MHDFNKFPELTNSQMEIYYFESPHKQMVEDFRAKVVKVVDGDTIRVMCDMRNFDFPIRFVNTNAPEMSEGGQEAKDWLTSLILNEEVDIVMGKNRVDKYGRLLAAIFSKGQDVGQMMMYLGLAKAWESRHEGEIPNANKELAVGQWF